ncbi:MAG: tRNA (guanosine(46)-N7)-methyltransferase TrmB [Desulfuromonas sp.]|nr:MAG: tRNA (guanosine(46)-N7)-methyltransferase TrmB [Desulfuromonas sp.]
MTQRMIEINSPYFIPEEQLKSAEPLARLFPGDQPIALEIGCGTGHFVAELATANPGTNYIAIDIYNKGCYKTCKKIEAQGLENVLVMRIEARYLLTHYIEKQSLAAVYINCPDPWPKKRHRSRRLVNESFMELLLHYLEPEGDFYFSTDFTDYAEQVGGMLPNARGYQNCLGTPWVNHLPNYPISKYMQRFLDRGQPIYFMHYRKLGNVSLSELSQPEILCGFRSRWGRAGNE